jgi:DNA-binding MarR family transcriptional regulator
MNIAKRFVLSSQTVARRLPTVLEKRGLDAGTVKRWLLTTDRGEVWLFAEMDTKRIARIERYTGKDLVHQVSTVCNGIPVALSNSSGLRYCFLLSQRPELPRRADFPGCERGLVRLGIGVSGQPVSVRWGDLGHVLVAGMTGSGKSNFLRLLVYQALAEGARLLLADVDGATFPMLAGHDALLAPIAQTPDDAHAIVAQGLAECDRRAALYQTVAGFPDKLTEYNEQAVKVGGDPLSRVVVILDEYNATATANGGNRGQFAHDVATLGWRGRKFGVNLVFAAQDFSKAVIGRVRDQVKTSLCFRVRGAEVARNIGTAGAHKIPESLPGRAVTDRWGTLQVYAFDKALLAQDGRGDILTTGERVLIAWALAENGGYLALADIEEYGDLSQRGARKLAQDWERRGWLVKDGDAANKRRVTDDLTTLAYNVQTAQTAQTALETHKPRTNDAQTNKGDQANEHRTRYGIQ